MKIRNFALSVLMVLLFSGFALGQVTISPNLSGGVLSPKNFEVEAPIAQSTAVSTATNNLSNFGNIAKGAVSNEVNVGNGIGNFSPSAKVDNKNYNSNFGINAQKQQMQQGQFGYVAPVQDVKVVFKSPTQLLPIMTAPLSEINFGNGQFIDTTKDFPMFDVPIAKFDPKTDKIKKVVDTTKNVKYVDRYDKFLSDAASALSKYKGKESKLRVQFFKAEAQKTIQAGVNLNGAGSGLPASGLAGGGGGGLLGLQGGSTKANPLVSWIIIEIS